MNWLRGVFSGVVTLALAACGATNTGNPGVDDAPEGIALVRSGLERELEPALSVEDALTFGDHARDFAFDLYGQATADNDGNVFLSPYSVRIALGMLYAGARAETKTEIAGALRFTLPEPELHAAFNATDLALTGRSDETYDDSFGEDPASEEPTGDVLLRVVNGAFGQKGASFQEPFLDTLAMHYDTGMYAADFAGQPERERMAINGWVADHTADRIQELIPMGVITPQVVLVLVNAIYFKASWLQPFNAANTASETFHAPGGDVTVQMMNGGADQYAEGDGYKALELPYVTPALRMLFILPDEGRFEEIEAALDRPTFDQIRGSLSRHIVTLKVPRFSFDSAFDLNEAMKALGMRQAFENGVADLSGIAGAPGELFVSKVLHKAFVAVDERGTEAAASTAVISVAVSAPPPADFFLDRPFLFAIYDEPTGQILFLGRVLDPT